VSSNVKRTMTTNQTIVNKRVASETCSHPIRFAGICTSCGAVLLDSEQTSSTMVVSTIPELKISNQQAQKNQEELQSKMLKDRKLALVLDLDNTLLHTVVAQEAQLPPFSDIPDFFPFTLDDGHQYYVKLRPNLSTFLKNVENLFEIYIYTTGTISYAKKITEFITKACGLSPNFFGDRIVTRDHTPGKVLTKDLRAIFPCDDSMVLIVDDREDVWACHLSNLLRITPYHFFQGAREVNQFSVHANRIVIQKDFDFVASKQQNTFDDGDDTDTDTDTDSGGGEYESDSDEEPNRENESKSDDDSDDNESGENKHNEAKKISDTKNKDDDEENGSSDGEDNEDDRNEAECPNVSSPVDTLNVVSEDIDTSVLCQRVKRPRETCESESFPVNKRCKVSVSSATEKTNEQQTAADHNRDLELLLPPLPTLITFDQSALQDDALLTMLEVLRDVHTAFYVEFLTHNKADVKEMLRRRKKRVLQGVHLTFSHIFPCNEKPQQQYIWNLAEQFGAICYEQFEEHITHVIAGDVRTEKVRRALQTPGVFVVTPLWLFQSIEKWRRADETKFLPEGVAPSHSQPSKVEEGEKAKVKNEIDSGTAQSDEETDLDFMANLLEQELPSVPPPSEKDKNNDDNNNV